MDFSYMNQIVYPCLSTCLHLPSTLLTRSVSIAGTICNRANTFMFATMLISEMAQFTCPERSLKARTAMQPVQTMIGFLFMQDEIDELSNCKEHWRNKDYTKFISTICDAGSELSAIASHAQYVGLLDMQRISQLVGRVPILKGLTSIGLDPICVAMGLIMHTCSIITVCHDVKAQYAAKGESITLHQQVSVICSATVLATKVAVIAGGCLGWAPTSTTLAVFGMTRTVVYFARFYVWNNY